MVSPSTSPATPLVPSEDAVLAQAGAENFPVASRFFPPAVRADLLAIYGFARLTDDIGDEAEGDRLALARLARGRAGPGRRRLGHPPAPPAARRHDRARGPCPSSRSGP